MFYGLKKAESGRFVLIVGLTKENCERMLEDGPICFAPGGENGKYMPNLLVAFVYRHADDGAAIPAVPPGKALLIVGLDAEELGRERGVILKHDFDVTPISSLLIFKEKDMQAVHEQVAGLIDPFTEVTGDAVTELLLARN